MLKVFLFTICYLRIYWCSPIGKIYRAKCRKYRKYRPDRPMGLRIKLWGLFLPIPVPVYSGPIKFPPRAAARAGE